MTINRPTTGSIGAELVVVVEYKKYDKVLQILSVKVIPHHPRERPTR